MKIIFLCGSLEPGRDGVGDYTRRIAGELLRKGHEAGIVALNDQYISGELNNLQESAGFKIQVLRLPDSLPFKQRFQRVHLWINEYNPEWLSMQFVPFAFHRKGLPFGMGNQLISLGKGRRWHIMFHELWVGMEINRSWKHFFLGLLQRRLIQSFVAKLQPAVIHTQARLYMQLLAKLGYNPLYLPLFGNISLGTIKAKQVFNERSSINNNSKLRSFVIFGGIHSGAPVTQLATDVATYCKLNNEKVLLTFIGRCGLEQNHWASTWEAAGLPIQILGEQPSERISEELSNASLGISTTPAALIDKSGSVAAMLEHGLPILCVSKSWIPRGIKGIELSPEIIEYTGGINPSIFFGQELVDNSRDISTITDQFVNNLLLSV